MVDIFQEIKLKVPMENILANYGFYPVKGRQYKCMFHQDKRPSASIYRGRFHCFVCNLTLDQIDFVKNYEKCSDTVALKIINDTFRLGLLEPPTATEQREREIATRKRDMKKMYAFTMQFLYDYTIKCLLAKIREFENEYEKTKKNWCCHNSLKMLEKYEWAYNKLVGLPAEDCEYEYTIGSTKEQILKNIITTKEFVL